MHSPALTAMKGKIQISKVRKTGPINLNCIPGIRRLSYFVAANYKDKVTAGQSHARRPCHDSARRGLTHPTAITERAYLDCTVMHVAARVGRITPCAPRIPETDKFARFARRGGAHGVTRPTPSNH